MDLPVSPSLAELLAASPGPSGFLDAQLSEWAGLTSCGTPSTSLDAAAAFAAQLYPQLSYVISGGAGRTPTATIVLLQDWPCCVSRTGSTPALALLAAFVDAVEQESAASSVSPSAL